MLVFDRSVEAPANERVVVDRKLFSFKDCANDSPTTWQKEQPKGMLDKGNK